MQDGRLGQPNSDKSTAEDEEMNIRVGDEVNHYHIAPEQQPVVDSRDGLKTKGGHRKEPETKPTPAEPSLVSLVQAMEAPTEAPTASLPVAAVLEEAKIGPVGPPGPAGLMGPPGRPGQPGLKEVPIEKPKPMGTAAKVATTLGAVLLGGVSLPTVAGLFGAFDKPAEVQQPAAVVDTDTFTVPTTIVKPHRPESES